MPAKISLALAALLLLGCDPPDPEPMDETGTEDSAEPDLPAEAEWNSCCGCHDGETMGCIVPWSESADACLADYAAAVGMPTVLIECDPESGTCPVECSA